MSLIDANELKKKKTILWDEALGFCHCVLIDEIDNAPVVDATEVVRCKDCEYWKPGDSKGGDSIEDLQVIGGCKWSKCCRREKDFCSYGKKRENN